MKTWLCLDMDTQKPSEGADSWAAAGCFQQYNLNFLWQNHPEFPLSLKQSDLAIKTS